MDVNGKPIQLDDKQDKILKQVSVCAFLLVLFGAILFSDYLLTDWSLYSCYFLKLDSTYYIIPHSEQSG